MTSTDIVNRSLEMISSQSLITSLTDGSPEATSANVIYNSQVNTLLRTYTWDFARKEVPLVTSGLTAPFPWTEEFLYPADGIELRTLYPSPSTINTYDPLPFRWAEGTNATPSRVIWTNLSTPVTVVYTWNALGQENSWDASFCEAIQCKLASIFAMSLAGRPDLSKALLEQAEQWISEGTGRDY